MPPGVIALIVALAVAAAAGLAWRRANGRMREPGRSRAARAAGGAFAAQADTAPPATAPPATAAPATSALPATTASPAPPTADSGTAAAGGITVADLGQPLGARATLLQFSTAFCAPCRATRRILAEVAQMTDGVAHIEIDAESRLDLVRRLDVRRTPAVFVLDATGGIVKRASGQPRKADVIAALGAVVL
jgi:thiol-disulfide isomerase/thioredoxin